MRKYLFLILVTSLVTVSAAAQKVERVAPVYGQDESANRMISYISENLKLMVPANQDLSTVQTNVRCKLTIDPSGAICDIEMMRSSAPLWLEVVIVEGLKAIPPSPSWRARERHQLGKELVFSFGNTGYQQKTYGARPDISTQQAVNAIERQRKIVEDSLRRHWMAWDKKISTDIKLPMPMSPDPKGMPDATLKSTMPPPPPPQLPKVKISME